MAVVLGIETSCDETAAAVVAGGREVRSNVVASQFDLHARYGGIVPEIASRAHLERLDAVLQEAMQVAGAAPEDIDAIAVTNRPGLVGCLLMGVTAAKTLAWAWGKPLIAVDHICAHAHSPAVEAGDDFWPGISLVVSGGHTSLYAVRDPCTIERIGATRDDAAGEAFDKVATVLGLGFPGGPAVEKLAREGDPRAEEFPRTLLEAGSLDFSFSGLKTAVLYRVHGPGKAAGGLAQLDEKKRADIAAGFQQAVVDVLVEKTMAAARRTGLRHVGLGGGVAANRAVREGLAAACAAHGYRFCAAPWSLCTDNAAMIAALGYHHFLRGDTAPLDIDAHAQPQRSPGRA